ncbi:hypothetical protein J3E68DRAFT_227223 [Trichoderma sp. SZMC 28012]
MEILGSTRRSRSLCTSLASSTPRGWVGGYYKRVSAEFQVSTRSWCSTFSTKSDKIARTCLKSISVVWFDLFIHFPSSRLLFLHANFPVVIKSCSLIGPCDGSSLLTRCRRGTLYRSKSVARFICAVDRSISDPFNHVSIHLSSVQL